MRLHRLEMTAFGPYAGTETVDFDELAQHGIFLLTGPTGAGKTSVLDAISYALFGAVPGARQSAKRLRSDHADAATRTAGSLELTISGHPPPATRPRAPRAGARQTAPFWYDDREGDRDPRRARRRWLAVPVDSAGRGRRAAL